MGCVRVEQVLYPEQPECPPEGEDASGIFRELCTLPALQACSDFPVQGLSPNGLENAGVPAKCTSVCDLARFRWNSDLFCFLCLLLK